MGPLGWIACGVVLGVALAPWVGVSAAGAVATTAIFALAGALAGWARPLALVVGVGIGLASIAALPEGPALRGEVAVRGVVAGASSGRGAPVVASAWAAPGGGWHRAEGRVQAVFPDAPPPAGTPVVLRGRAAPIGPSWPGAPDPVRAAARERAKTSIRVASWAPIGGLAPLRRDPYARARHGGALLALVTGDRRRLPRATMDVFRRTGTAHVIAISGAHIAVVALTGVLAARRALRLVALVRPEGVSETPAWVIGAVLAVAYTSFVGAPASAWRAAAAMVLVAVAQALGRETHPMRLLAVVCAAHVLVDPGVLATPAFQLSYGAVLGLVQVTPRIAALVPPDRSLPVDFLARSVAMTLGATVGTLPALAWWFQELAPLTVVANLVAVPVITWVVAPGAAVGWLAPEPLGGWGVAFADRSLDVLLWALRRLDVTPWVLAAGPGGALALLAVLALPRLRAQVPVLAVAVAFVLRPPARGGVVVAGGEVPAVLVHAEGRRWLVDGGPPGRGVVGWLRREGVERIDVVACPRGGRARCGAQTAVVAALPVGQVWVPDDRPAKEIAQVAASRGVVVVRVPGEALRDQARRVAVAAAERPP